MRAILFTKDGDVVQHDLPDAELPDVISWHGRLFVPVLWGSEPEQVYEYREAASWAIPETGRQV